MCSRQHDHHSDGYYHPHKALPNDQSAAPSDKTLSSMESNLVGSETGVLDSGLDDIKSLDAATPSTAPAVQDPAVSLPVACCNPRCDKLITSAAQLVECSGCRRAWYCRKECLKAHRKQGHSAACTRAADADDRKVVTGSSKPSKKSKSSTKSTLPLMVIANLSSYYQEVCSLLRSILACLDLIQQDHQLVSGPSGAPALPFLVSAPKSIFNGALLQRLCELLHHRCHTTDKKQSSASKAKAGVKAVSYTHLTLPTNREV